MSFIGRRNRERLKNLLKEAAATSWILFKILIPVSIAARLLEQWGAVEFLGRVLKPVMEIAGLPGEMGLVWAAAMITNLYGGMVVFTSLAPSLNMTVAQVSVLTTMMLIAHSLPVELRIAQKAGVRARFMGPLRIGGALTVGFLLSRIYKTGNFLKERNISLWTPTGRNDDWTAWAINEARNLIMIFFVILAMLFLMKMFKQIGVTDFLTGMLEPLLKALGLGGRSAPLTIIGMTLGISYGGGLIIRESRSGRIARKDVLFSLTLMGLCHSLIEDTLLMALLGGHHSGILWARILFAAAVVFVLIRVVGILPGRVYENHLVRPVSADKSADP